MNVFGSYLIEIQMSLKHDLPGEVKNSRHDSFITNGNCNVFSFAVVWRGRAHTVTEIDAKQKKQYFNWKKKERRKSIKEMNKID